MSNTDHVLLEHTPVKLVYTHSPVACSGRPCTIHNRSDHHMRHLPQRWRSDFGFMERICEHGIGHPDPDELPKFVHRAHLCDGCCTPIPNLNSVTLSATVGNVVDYAPLNISLAYKDSQNQLIQISHVGSCSGDFPVEEILDFAQKILDTFGPQ